MGKFINIVVTREHSNRTADLLPCSYSVCTQPSAEAEILCPPTLLSLHFLLQKRDRTFSPETLSDLESGPSLWSWLLNFHFFPKYKCSVKPN